MINQVAVACAHHCRRCLKLAHSDHRRQPNQRLTYLKEQGTAMHNPAVTTRKAIRSMPMFVVIGLLAWLAVPLSVAKAQNSDPGLVGSYSVNIVLDDVPRTVKFGPMIIGQWQIDFNSDGSYAMTRADVGLMVSGTFKVNGGEVTVT